MQENKSEILTETSVNQENEHGQKYLSGGGGKSKGTERGKRKRQKQKKAPLNK